MTKLEVTGEEAALLVRILGAALAQDHNAVLPVTVLLSKIINATQAAQKEAQAQAAKDELMPEEPAKEMQEKAEDAG